MKETAVSFKDGLFGNGEGVLDLRSWGESIDSRGCDTRDYVLHASCTHETWRGLLKEGARAVRMAKLKTTVLVTPERSTGL